jgi:hypothetical protein
MAEARQEQQRYGCHACPPPTTAVVDNTPTTAVVPTANPALDEPLRPIPWWEVGYRALIR